MYINGELKITESHDPEAITYTYPEQELPSFIIGHGYNELDGDEQFFFEGKVDDLRVYNRIIEEEDIMVLANNDCSGYEEEEGDGADADGISDAVENAAPNSGDGNNDGTPDSEQNNVTSLSSPVNNKYVTLEVDSDCDLSSVGITSEDSKTVKDSGYSYPAGLLSFTAACEEANVKVFFYGETAAVVRKHNPNTNAYFTIAGATTAAQAIGGQSVTVVTYTVTDGGELDVDGQDNGTIVDPVGLASLAVGVPNTGLGGKQAN